MIKFIIAMLAMAQWLPDQKNASAGSLPTPPPVGGNSTFFWLGF
jgi:hypothetical protein